MVLEREREKGTPIQKYSPTKMEKKTDRYDMWNLKTNKKDSQTM